MNEAVHPKRRNFLGTVSLSLMAAAAQLAPAAEVLAATRASSKSDATGVAHVDAYFEALAAKDKRGIVPHLAGNIELLGPIFAEPTQGRETVVQVLAGFLDTIDTLEVHGQLASGRDVAVFFSFTVQGITVKGNEHLHLDENGLIDHIEVAWRPLPAAVQVQEIIARKLGFQPLRLVPAA